MHIKSLTLVNIGPFQGKQVIPLSKGAYAVTAKDVDNPRRSNWLGKTTFLEAIPFAIYGAKFHRQTKVSDIITTGKDDAGVIVEFSDRSTIKRLINSKGTTLEFSDGTGTYTSKVAQERIIKHIGLSQVDFFASCFVQQKELSRLVRCEPSERFKIVSNWLDLAYLERCFAIAKEKLVDAQEALRLAEQLKGERLSKLLVGGQQWDLEFDSQPHTAKTLQAMVEALIKKKDEATAKVTTLQARIKTNAFQLDRIRKTDSLKEKAERYKDLCKQKATLKSQLIEQPQQLSIQFLQEVASDIAGQAYDKRKEIAAITPLAKGEFNGCCPLTKGECPSQTYVKAERLNYGKRLEVMTGELVSIREAEQNAREILATAELNNSKSFAVREQIKQIDEMLAPMRSAFDEYRTLTASGVNLPGFQEVLAKHSEDSAELRAQEVNATRLERYINECKTAVTNVTAYEQKIHHKRQKVAAHQQAVLVFGKNGAQRILAERGLSFIETKANDFLIDANIALSIRVAWGKETNALSFECPSCGHEYGESQRVKECPKCSEDRPPKMTEKLSFDISDTSGAAEDIAGLSFQIAASQYLNQQRNTTFSTLCLDEPFGHLDAHNRDALATYLTAMLISSGFDQAFIVAHDSGIMNMLPNRIEIESKDGASIVKTVG